MTEERDLLNQIAVDIGVMKNDLTYVKGDIAELKIDVSADRKDISKLKAFKSNIKGAVWVIVTAGSVGAGISLLITPLLD